ncbi:hypothetical protein OIDMADRAFT_16316 [Oidiodendron maius Zn]|uniref:Uncharacterized protein n=1 Tax=Oidiodendron maius (strain Zn) TaxID=913774 RepID=A0A0C3HY18_OIDMZ|nr:hypothetical protein OIDMADRAFT_16316 [Oidiodendron maius Zn]
MKCMLLPETANPLKSGSSRKKNQSFAIVALCFFARDGLPGDRNKEISMLAEEKLPCSAQLRYSRLGFLQLEKKVQGV